MIWNPIQMPVFVEGEKVDMRPVPMALRVLPKMANGVRYGIALGHKKPFTAANRMTEMKEGSVSTAEVTGLVERTVWNQSGRKYSRTSIVPPPKKPVAQAELKTRRRRRWTGNIALEPARYSQRQSATRRTAETARNAMMRGLDQEYSTPPH